MALESHFHRRICTLLTFAGRRGLSAHYIALAFENPCGNSSMSDHLGPSVPGFIRQA